MNRRIALLGTLLLVIVLAIPAATAIAAPQIAPTLKPMSLVEAKDFAAYFPADTLIYVSLRTDDAYVDALDGILAKVAAKFPPGVLPPLNFRGSLEQTLRQIGVDYAADVRSWLGDRVAAGVDASVFKGAGPDAMILAVVSITDKAKAEAFIDKVAAPMIANKVLTKETGDVTRYTSATPSVGVEIEIRSDVMLLGTPKAVKSTMLRDAKLDSAPLFTETTGLLPANSYNILGYVNYPELIQAGPYLMQNQPPMNRTILDAVGPIAVGATILDDRSLVIDYGVKAGDTAKLEALGLPKMSTKPVDPAFAANLPVNSALVAHGTDLKSIYDMLLAWTDVSYQMSTGSKEKLSERGLAQFREQVKKLLNLDWDADILSWLTGDYAAFVAYDVPKPGDPESFVIQLLNLPQPVEVKGIEAGLVIKAVDAAKAKNLAAKLGALLSAQSSVSSNPKVTASKEQISGADATVLTLSGPQIKPFDLVLAANDNVLVFATRGAATAALAGSGGFDKSAGYVEASKYVLPNATNVWYLDSGAINLGVDLGAVISVGTRAMMGNMAMTLQNTPTPTPDSSFRDAIIRQIAAFQALGRTAASLLSSSSISTAVNANSDTSVRLVLTLAE